MSSENEDKRINKSPWAKLTRYVSQQIDSFNKDRRTKEEARIFVDNFIKKDKLTEELLIQQIKLEKRKKILAQVDSSLPIFLEKEEQMLILEALLLARVRDEKPVADVIAAIELIKADAGNLMPEQTSKSKETIVTHKYRIPILSEIAVIIDIMTTLAFTAPLVFSFIFLFLNPIKCDTQVTILGEFQNRSRYCKAIAEFNHFFFDYQKVDKSKD